MSNYQYTVCVECHQARGAKIHDTSLTTADTGEAQHPFIPGPIFTKESA